MFRYQILKFCTSCHGGGGREGGSVRKSNQPPIQKNTIFWMKKRSRAQQAPPHRPTMYAEGRPPPRPWGRAAAGCLFTITQSYISYGFEIVRLSELSHVGGIFTSHSLSHWRVSGNWDPRRSSTGLPLRMNVQGRHNLPAVWIPRRFENYDGFRPGAPSLSHFMCLSLRISIWIRFYR